MPPMISQKNSITHNFGFVLFTLFILLCFSFCLRVGLFQTYTHTQKKNDTVSILHPIQYDKHLYSHLLKTKKIGFAFCAKIGFARVLLMTTCNIFQFYFKLIISIFFLVYKIRVIPYQFPIKIRLILELSDGNKERDEESNDTKNGEMSKHRNTDGLQ